MRQDSVDTAGKPKCLVLGGSGFLGSHLLDELATRGWSPWILDLNEPKGNRSGDCSPVWIQAEFAKVDDWEARLSGVEVIFHCLGTTLPSTSNNDPIFDVQSNLVATLQLLNGAVRAGVKRIVFFSSGGTVYGIPQQLPIPETHPTDPICSYGVVKLAIEKYLRLYYHLYGLDYLIVRLSNPYGEHQNPLGQQGALTVFLGRLVQGEPIFVWGDGSIVRDFLYVKDAIKGVLAALDHSGPHRLFNVASNRGTSLRELLAVIEKVTGLYDRVEYLPARAEDVPVNVLDTRRLCEATGWSPSTELTEGIARTWNWVRKTLSAC